ncbi:TetR family transcriptional regulator [Planosporangium thailandense]|uniref:TetR family transcriptional regulator n=1 Tax=Planosporangium thailandense TaxID=765197 RepID=A0ABX0Y600_9ACTN|nr:TetR family transcriptional regulator [Planosporangium thailandense]NJC72837.1 TetR family transcriptional regulator [Planosporangium thailandense]
MGSPGLRERKKQKTRWAIQEHALRLFAEQGYEATTVEQIAAAAEVSPSTFFRYFPTKEDVVVQDEYDPMLISALESAPAELAPVPAVRHAIHTAFAQLGPADTAKVLERGRLSMSVPALRARVVENLTGTIDVLAGPLARRSGREPDDFAVRALAGACLGALLAAVFAWLESNGEQDLPGLIDEALAHLESGFLTQDPRKA